MVFVFILLSCLAAVWVGWTLGPLAQTLTQRIELSSGRLVENIRNSAKNSAEKSKKLNKYYSTLGISYNDEQTRSKRSTWTNLITVTLFLTFLAFALISGYPIFWELFGIMFVILFWDRIIEVIWGFIMFPFGEKKKK